MLHYKLVTDKDGNTITIQCQNTDSGSATAIPIDPNNSDYKTYLSWVEAGNTPDPAS